MVSAARFVSVDLGTGDGQFVYHTARCNPDQFCIGIDPNARPLEKISEKIHRKSGKGGAPNALYVLASAENLPAELNGIAEQVTVHFPWGSLLRAVVAGDPQIIGSIRRICKPGAALCIVSGLDAEKDQGEIDRLDLPDLTPRYVETDLLHSYRDAGFELQNVQALSSVEIASMQTSWAKKLHHNKRRQLFRLNAVAK